MNSNKTPSRKIVIEKGFILIAREARLECALLKAVRWQVRLLPGISFDSLGQGTKSVLSLGLVWLRN